MFTIALIGLDGRNRCQKIRESANDLLSGVGLTYPLGQFVANLLREREQVVTGRRFVFDGTFLLRHNTSAFWFYRVKPSVTNGLSA